MDILLHTWLLGMWCMSYMHVVCRRACCAAGTAVRSGSLSHGLKDYKERKTRSQHEAQSLNHLCGELWYHTRAEGFSYVSFTHTIINGRLVCPIRLITLKYLEQVYSLQLVDASFHGQCISCSVQAVVYAIQVSARAFQAALPTSEHCISRPLLAC
jgi:hypothetical protein